MNHSSWSLFMKKYNPQSKQCLFSSLRVLNFFVILMSPFIALHKMHFNRIPFLLFLLLFHYFSFFSFVMDFYYFFFIYFHFIITYFYDLCFLISNHKISLHLMHSKLLIFNTLLELIWAFHN